MGDKMLTENKTVTAEETIKCLTQKINDKSENIKDWNKAIQFAFTDAETH